MNDARRKAIKATLAKFDTALLADLATDIGMIADEEQEAFDAMPESLQDGDRGTEMQENIEKLQAALDCINNAIEAVEEAEGTLQEVS